jgi:hypothetical protein
MTALVQNKKRQLGGFKFPQGKKQEQDLKV